MKKVGLILCMVAALLVASQASAVTVTVAPDTATWNEEPVTGIVAEPNDASVTSYTWDPNVIEGGVEYTWFNTNAPYSAANPSITIQKSGEYLINGDMENWVNRTNGSVFAGVRPRYGIPLQGEGWRAYNNNTNGNQFRYAWPSLEEPTWLWWQLSLQGNAFSYGPPEGTSYLYVYCRYSDTGSDRGYPEFFPRTFEAAGQLLNGVTFDPNVPITLSAYVGRFPENLFPYNGYALQICAGGENVDILESGLYNDHITGGVVIAEDLNGVVPDPNTFLPTSVTYTKETSLLTPEELDALAGEPIQVRLVAFEDLSEPNLLNIPAVAFDDVQVTVDGLSADPAATRAVVEYTVTTNVPDVTDTVLIEVYDDCAGMNAAVGGHAGDFDGDCDVDLVDYSIVAAGWVNFDGLLSLADTWLDSGPVALP